MERTYQEYWANYLRAHSRPATRACHYLATLVGAGCGLAAAVTGTWWLLAAGIGAGYVIAFSSHFLIERNLPRAHRPLWGWISDLRMCGLALRGRLREELERTAAADPR